MRLEAPLITVVGRKLSAVGTFPPAEAAVRKQKLRYPDPLVALLEFIQPLRGSLVEGIPRPVVVTAAYPARRNQVAEVMEQVKRRERRADMRNGFALVQSSVGEELQPQKNGIVIEAHEAKVRLVKRWLVEPVLLERANPWRCMRRPRSLMNS